MLLLAPLKLLVAQRQPLTARWTMGLIGLAGGICLVAALELPTVSMAQMVAENAAASNQPVSFGPVAAAPYGIRVVDGSTLPPLVATPIADQTLWEGGAISIIDLQLPPAVFVSPNRDLLTFTASSSDSLVATALIAGSTLTVTPLSVGL